MLGANIDKTCNVGRRSTRNYETLTKQECKKLRKKTLGHGNMVAAEIATGKDRGLILRAISGQRVLSENAAILRAYINPPTYEQ